MQTFFSILTIIITLGCVIFLAYVMTKFVGKKSMNMMKSKYMTVIDSLSMGFDRTIYLVKVGEQYVLMYSSTKGFEFICNVEASKIDPNSVQENNTQNKSFSKYFDFFSKEQNKKVGYVSKNDIQSNIERMKSFYDK